MSMENTPPAQTRGYVRPSVRHAASGQIAALTAADVDEALIYVEGRASETWAAAVRSLHPGDTLAVASLARLAGTRDGVRARLLDVTDRGATVVEVSTGRRVGPGSIEAAMATFDAVEELSQDRRVFDRESATKAAEARWGTKGRMPLSQAEEIWRDTDKYRTVPEALEVMYGWSKSQAYAKFKDRGTRARRKQR